MFYNNCKKSELPILKFHSLYYELAFSFKRKLKINFIVLGKLKYFFMQLLSFVNI